MRLTIGKKLNSLTLSLLLLSIGGVVVLAVQLFTADLEGLLRKGTLDVSSMLAGRVRAEMKHVADRTRMLGAASLEDFKYEEDRLRFIQDNLAVDSQYIGMGLYRQQPPNENFTPIWRVGHPELTQKLGLTASDFNQLDQLYPIDFRAVSKGLVDFTIAKLKDGTPTIRMSLPLVQRNDGTFSQLMTVELHQEKLTALFSESTAYTSYLIDRRGKVLGSTDPSHIALGEEMNGITIVGSLKEAKNSSGQMDFKDKTGEMQIGAFQRVGFAELTIISQVPFKIALMAQKQVFRRTIFLAGAFLFFALVLGFLFSQSITGPIKLLAGAALRVQEGDFTVRLKTSKKSRSRDEIQEFSGTFNQMVIGLEERDRVKATFAKFHSKEVAEKILSGQLKLGGERKNATVFFSDVRGFTAMSETMDPEALVKVLNRYMSRMVRVILEHGGIVDKYVGDAIMAIWGVPLSKVDDCERALLACIHMRKALAELNQELRTEGLPQLKIGMGLNYGPLIAGNIGSDERMEYTVIGDTVNTASRIESLTKEFGTDCLVSETILEQVSGKFVTEKTHSAKVKGKKEALAIYKLLGYIDSQGQTVLVETPFSSYQPEKSDKVVHEAPQPPPWPPRQQVVQPPPWHGLQSDKETHEAA